MEGGTAQRQNAPSSVDESKEGEGAYRIHVGRSGGGALRIVDTQ